MLLINEAAGPQKLINDLTIRDTHVMRLPDTAYIENKNALFRPCYRPGAILDVPSCS